MVLEGLSDWNSVVGVVTVYKKGRQLRIFRIGLNFLQSNCFIVICLSLLHCLSLPDSAANLHQIPIDRQIDSHSKVCPGTVPSSELSIIFCISGAARGWDALSPYTHNSSNSSMERFLPEPFIPEPGVYKR